MKNPMRMQAATVVVLEAMKRALNGHPLPVHTDEGFEDFKNAVARVAKGDDFRWLGKGLILPVAEHVAQNLTAQRQLASTKE